MRILGWHRVCQEDLKRRETPFLQQRLLLCYPHGRSLLAKAPGVALVDEPEASRYPMPLTATNKYDVEVGRIRRSLVFGKMGLDFFVCGDQLLRGAASNAVFIAEAILWPER